MSELTIHLPSLAQPAVAGERSSATDITPPPLGILMVMVAATLVMALFASTYVPYRILTWSLAATEGYVNRTFLTPALWFLAIASFVSGFRWVIFVCLTIVALRQYYRRVVPRITEWPLVSVFVPAYNEGETIAPALESLIALRYPRLEVIVVDDGSKDETYERAKPFEGDHGHCRIFVYRKPNGGKWSALNFAFSHSTGELCLCVDADSRLSPDSVRLMVERLADPELDAVAGQIRVRNRVNLLTRLQGLEYVMASGALRLAQSHSGCVLVVPGPLGLYRRSAMEEVFMHWGADGEPAQPGHVHGPLEGDTFAEDFDLSLAVLSLGGRIVYEPYAISHTKAPVSPSALISQRYRWARGTLQVLRKFVVRSRKYPRMLQARLVGWLGITYGAEMFFLPFAYALGMCMILMSLLSGGSLPHILLGASPILLLSLNAAAFCIALHRDRFSLLPPLLIYDFYHGFMLNSAWLIAVIDEVRGAKMRWS